MTDSFVFMHKFNWFKTKNAKMSFKMSFSFGLIELIQVWQVAYLAKWVDSKIKRFPVTKYPKKLSCCPF